MSSSSRAEPPVKPAPAAQATEAREAPAATAPTQAVVATEVVGAHPSQTAGEKVDRPAAGEVNVAEAGRAPVLLKVRRIGIDTYRENVAYLHRDCGVVRAEGFQALAKVDLSVGGNGRSISAVLNVVDDEQLVGCDEIGLSEQAYDQLGVEPGTPVAIEQAEPPASIQALRQKIAGERIGADDYFALMRDISQRRYSKIELAAFVVATSRYELDRDEVVHLTQGMVASGRRFDWVERPVVDKHCIGGIPGNRTSMLVVPIVAAHGMLIPKTSSRAITSPAGTADTMEVLAEVDLSFARMADITRSLRGCLAWGGKVELAPADDVLISVERPLSIDSPGQMVASILSKKIAAGSTHIVLDIPVGPTAKVRSMSEAHRLRRLFEYVAQHVGLALDVVITDGRQPIGNGIGPVLEARDVMQVLDGDPQAPSDLRQKALRLAGRVIEFDPDVRGGDGFRIARNILDSGRALQKMHQIIEAQGRRSEAAALGQLTLDVQAPSEGTVVGIDNFHLARIARVAGAPKFKGAGVDLFRKLGDPVRAGDVLYRVHADFPADMRFARRLVDRTTGYSIGQPELVPEPFVEF